MKTPSYRWVCHKCGATNEAYIAGCANCGFPAVASAQDIDQSGPNYKPPLYADERKAENARRIALFFPEGAFAAIVVLITPIWSIKLATSGHMVAAAFLFAGIALALYALYFVSARRLQISGLLRYGCGFSTGLRCEF